MNAARRTIVFTQEGFERLKAAYEEAVTLSQDSFTVDIDKKTKDVEFDTRYAKYLLEMLAAEFAANPMPKYPANKEGEEP